MDSTESDWTCFKSAEVKKYKKKTVDNMKLIQLYLMSIDNVLLKR